MKNKTCPVCGQPPRVREDKKLSCITKGCMINEYLNTVYPEVWNGDRSPAFTPDDWHSPDEEPERGRPIIILYKTGHVESEYTKEEFKYNKSQITAWAYTADLPKPEETE